MAGVKRAVAGWARALKCVLKSASTSALIICLTSSLINSLLSSRASSLVSSVGGVLAIALFLVADHQVGRAGEGPRLDLAEFGLTDEQRRVLISSFTRPSDKLPFESQQAEPAMPERDAARLGRQLFFDKRLSSTGQIACASCHNPRFGWESPLKKPVGVTGKPLARQASTLLGVGSASLFLWDGAAQSLESQAFGPLSRTDEMAANLPQLVAWLRADPDYAAAFQAVFGEAPSATHLVVALAAFQRRIWPALTAFDRWVEGDRSALSPMAERGFYLFNGRARCAACHAGWLFTDRRFHDIGLETTDLGRGLVEPDVPSRQFAFKTPTLRQIKDRAPYMHNGSMADLRAVLQHYQQGLARRSTQSPLIEPIDLSDADIAALLAFLETL